MRKTSLENSMKTEIEVSYIYKQLVFNFKIVIENPQNVPECYLLNEPMRISGIGMTSTILAFLLIL